MRHDLPPVDASQVSTVFGGDKAIGHQQVVQPVIIKIDKFRAPRPSSQSDAGGDTDVFERASGHGLKEGIAEGNVLKAGADLLGKTGLKLRLIRDPIPGAGKHVTGVNVHPSVMIKV